MRVRWFIPAYLSADAGDQRDFDQEIPAGAERLGEALRLLGERYPKLLERITDDRGEIREHVNIFVRGEMVRMGLGLATPLREGDEIIVLHAVSGGC